MLLLLPLPSEEVEEDKEEEVLTSGMVVGIEERIEKGAGALTPAELMLLPATPLLECI